jgi:hypothetical protein
MQKIDIPHLAVTLSIGDKIRVTKNYKFLPKAKIYEANDGTKSWFLDGTIESFRSCGPGPVSCYCELKTIVVTEEGRRICLNPHIVNISFLPQQTAVNKVIII